MGFEKKRESGLEALKVLCMFLVVCLHICTQSGITNSPVSIPDGIFFIVIQELGRTACSVFVMISAWFLSELDFKTERVFRVWFKTSFYILVFCFLVEHLHKMPLHEFFLTGSESLWFISAYLCMLLFTPVLNAVLKLCPQKYVLASVLLTGIPMLTFSTFSLTDGYLGNNVIWFMWLYLLMGYLKKYPVKLFENRLLMLAVFGAMYFIRIFPRIHARWSGTIPVFKELIPYLDWYGAVLWTIPNFLTAISLFYVFAGLKLKDSRVMRFFGKHTLAIYAIHQMPFFYEYMWNGIFHCLDQAGTPMEIPYTLFVVLCLFVSISVIDEIFDRLIAKPVISVCAPCFKKIDGLLK